MNDKDNAGGPWEITPVGRVNSAIKTPMLVAGDEGLELTERMEKIRAYHKKVKQNVCRLEIFDPWVALLDGIEGFSHVLVIYWPHLMDPVRRNLKKVHPMGRKDLPKQGIFATRSPARPNPVLVSAVALTGREKNTLFVKGLEAVDGSPIIDVKPYVESYDGPVNAKVPQWMARIREEMAD